MEKNIIVIGQVDHGKTIFIKALNRLINNETECNYSYDEDSYSVSYSIGDDTYTVFDYGGRHQYVDNIGKKGEWAAILVCSSIDGPMEETRKHIELCRERGIKRIAVFFSECDIMEDDDLIDMIEWDLNDILDENGFSTDCPKLRGSAGRALDWAQEKDKKAFFHFLNEIHRMK